MATCVFLTACQRMSPHVVKCEENYVRATRLRDAVCKYARVNGKLPSVLQDLDFSQHVELSLLDTWGHPFRYVTVEGEGLHFRIYGLGRDNAAGGEGDDLDIDLGMCSAR